MKINSLEQMETIVDNNKFLKWDGWNVKEVKASSTGWMKPEGVYLDGQWHIQKHYTLDHDGWNIPSKFVRDDAK
jgi:hypothetical protein